MSDLTRIQLRRDNQDLWVDANIVLAKGEVGVAYPDVPNNDPRIPASVLASGGTVLQDYKRTLFNGEAIGMKIGDGISSWKELPYYYPFHPITAVLTATTVTNGVVSRTVIDRTGQGRDLENITQTGVSHNFYNPWEAIDAILYPYASPSFTSFTPSSYTAIEVGLTHNPNRIYSWSSSPAANVKIGGVSISQNFNGNELSVATAQDANGSFTATTMSILTGTTIGSYATYILRGINTKNINMTPLSATLNWVGKCTYFTQYDDQCLFSDGLLNTAVGEKTSVYIGSTGATAAVCQTALNNSVATLGNAAFGSPTIDFGQNNANGYKQRLYVLYPKIYRTSFGFQDPTTGAYYANTSQEITLNRNGVNVEYNLFVLNTNNIAGNLKINFV